MAKRYSTLAAKPRYMKDQEFEDEAALLPAIEACVRLKAKIVERAAQIAVALGGRALPACPWAERRPILVAGSLAELVAFVRGAGLGRVS